MIACDALPTTKERFAFTVFERAFKEFALPETIRTGSAQVARREHGVPFASPNSLFNLSKLSVWWLRLGITIERIQPRRPQQSGRHERLHLTLKKEATRPAGENFLQQQDNFDAFIDCFTDCLSGLPLKRHSPSWPGFGHARS
jgi:putative transposase